MRPAEQVVCLAGMPPRPSLLEIFLVALRLGVTSFDGPVAHLAFFRKEDVEKRRWLDEAHYADLVALCQFLPGPASSQTGFGVGYLQRGLGGRLAAWLGFTLPSAGLMIGFAYGVTALGNLEAAGWSSAGPTKRLSRLLPVQDQAGVVKRVPLLNARLGLA